MADNVAVTPGSGAAVASDEAPYSGENAQFQIVQLAFVTGAEGSRTAAKLPGDGTDGLKIQIGKPLGSLTSANSLSVAPASDAVFQVEQGQLTEALDTVKTAPLRVSTNPTKANVTASTSSAAIFASNANARQRIVVNDSDRLLMLNFGDTASATAYSVPIPPKDTNGTPSFYEFPHPVFTGAVNGIWASGVTGAARTTEFV